MNEVDQVECVDGHANWSDPVMADIYRVFNVEVITTGTNFQRQHKKNVWIASVKYTAIDGNTVNCSAFALINCRQNSQVVNGQQLINSA